MNLFRRRKENTPIHRSWLITRYETDIREETPFRNMVLREGIRKLKETDLKPTQVENWVEGVLHAWKTIPKK